MIDNQETQEKIAAEVRDLSKFVRNKVELGEYIDVPMPTAFGKPLDVYYAELADRIEAAAKRETVTECNRLGNAAKMREALVEIIDYLAPIRKWTLPSRENHTKLTALFAVVETVYTKARAALTEPQRNCDVGTLKEQKQRFHDFCEKMQHTDRACCGGCPIVHLRLQGIIGSSCELAWAQMPYESEAKK